LMLPSIPIKMLRTIFLIGFNEFNFEAVM
jgi:hypothetical protein